jgi:hypothetical protein
MINDLWYKNAVIYCLSVATYMDANGDGVGDFEGLIRRLDYLQGMGVTAIWLMPFQPSPFKDDGYDVADYYGVDPRYGSLGDFVESSIPGSRRLAATRNPSIATGTSGPRRSRRTPTPVSSFRVCRSQRGTTTRQPRNITSIASMIFSPI